MPGRPITPSGAIAAIGITAPEVSLNPEGAITLENQDPESSTSAGSYGSSLGSRRSQLLDWLTVRWSPGRQPLLSPFAHAPH